MLALERIKNNLVEFADEDYTYDDYVTDILTIENELKSLSVIIDKDLDIKVFKDKCLLCNYRFYLKYNKSIMFGMTNALLNNEEYDLLKGVFNGR